MMKDSGCAFKVVDADGVRYYTSPEVLGLADFARSLDLCQYFGQKKSKDYAAFFSSSSSFCCGVK